MSAISSLGGNVQGIFQFIQGLSGTSQSQAAGATTSTTSSTDPTQSATQAVSGGHHRHRHGGGSGVFKQIQDAVTNALQTAQSSGTSSDPNQIVESAIAQVLKASTSAAGTTTPATTATATPTTAAQTPSTDPDGDGDPATEATGGTSSMASFFQALQTAGIDPKQFHQDFLNAIKDAQGGQVNPSTAFQSIPVGSTIDTLG